MLWVQETFHGSKENCLGWKSGEWELESVPLSTGMFFYLIPALIAERLYPPLSVVPDEKRKGSLSPGRQI